MKRTSATERPALELIDDTIALVRSCPLATGLCYYIGAVPFILAFLYYWTDMSRGAFAREHLVEFSLVVAVSFVWCKFWQAIYAARLAAVAARRTPPPLSAGSLARILVAQTAIQPSGLFLLPVALVVTIPFAITVAFYHSASVLALDIADQPQGIAALRKEALARALQWQRQNWVALSVLWFFGLIVFLNILILILSLPFLLKTLFGVNTMFSRSIFSMFNTTLFASAGGLTYLCVDPIIKAFYVVRCFHGRAETTGDDLRVRLRRIAPAALAASAAVMMLAWPAPIHGALSTPAPAKPAAVDSSKIDNSINEVLNRPEFAWRAPRQTDGSAEEKAADNFGTGLVRLLRKWLHPVKGWIEKIGDWFVRSRLNRDDSQEGKGIGAFPRMLPFLAWSFCILAAGALGVFAFKMWMRRGETTQVVAEAVQAMPDLESEDLMADQLPQDEWLNLAHEMVRKGDLRLALRALYLAALASLGEKKAISIARSKSNHEYKRELRRRRPAQTELQETFSDTVGEFERAWYGLHEVSRDSYDSSERNLDRIRQS